MKPILTLFLVCISFVLTAQEDIYKIIATETCECITKKNVDVKNRSEVEMALGLCMMESFQAHEVDIDVSDEQAMTKFGEKVGMKMAPICPTVFASFIGDEEPEEPSAIELSGTVKSIETGEFLFLVFKESSGKEHKLLWLRYFPGSDDFKDEPKKLVGKKMTITYQEMECFFPKLKAYYNAKEILSLKLD